MSYDALLIERVTLHNPSEDGGEDRYGNPTEEWDDVPDTPARIEQLDAEENLQYRDTRITRYRIFLLAGAPVTGLTEVTWNSKRYTIAGEPSLELDVDGVHHPEAVLEGVEG